MEENQTSMGIEELAERVGVPTRTVRFYIAEGLLPGPGSRGKSATYGDEHLIRLRLIRRLSERHVPLAETRAALDRLTLEEARALLAEEDARARELERAAQAASPRDYVASLLERARAARGPATRPAKPSRPAPSAAPIQPRQVAAPSAPSAAPAFPLPPSWPAQPVPPPAAVPDHSGQSLHEAPGRYPAKWESTGETWRRWQLAPGVELHVRDDAAHRFRALIERLLRAARDHQGKPSS